MSVERFCATTPLCRTSSGSRGSAIATRLLTSITALSTFDPTSNVQVIVSVPLDAARRAEVDQVLDAGELLLDRRGDGRASVSALAPG